MSFLLTQITFLLLAAFFCGVVLAYLWMRGRYEDVTLEFERLEQKSKESGVSAEQPTADIRALLQRFESLERAMGSGGQAAQAVDLAPVLERLSSIERQLSSVGPIPVDLELVNARIGGLERKLDAVVQGAPVRAEGLPEGLSSQMAALSAAVSALSAPAAVDLSGVIERLSALEQKCEEMPGPVDLGPLQAEVAALSSRLGERAAVDLSSVGARLDAIDVALRERAPGREGLPEGLSEGLSSQMAALSAAVSALSAPAAVDLSGVIERLSALEQKCEQLRAAPAAPAPSQPAASALIDAVRVTEGRNLLSKAAFGEPDDIEIIKGIGPKLREMLHKIGVYYFWQIAAWTEDDVSYVDGLLEAFQGRIVRDAWVAQAVELAKDPKAAKPPGK